MRAFPTSARVIRDAPASELLTRLLFVGGANDDIALFRTGRLSVGRSLWVLVATLRKAGAHNKGGVWCKQDAGQLKEIRDMTSRYDSRDNVALNLLFEQEPFACTSQALH